MILSVAVITKEGRTLLARQFTADRSQIEGYLGAFPKLVVNERHSYIETEAVRYVFQDLVELYFILITTKDSNVMEDMVVLSLMVNLTREIVQPKESQISEESVQASALELIFAYDECIVDGYRQNVTIADVRSFLAMESHEEAEFLKQRRDKEAKAATELNRKMKELERERKKQGGSRHTEMSSIQSPMILTTTETTVVETASRAKPMRAAFPNRQGMSLGKRATPKDKAQQMIIEEGLAGSALQASPAGVTPPVTAGSAVTIKLIEQLSTEVNRFGTVSQVAVEGRLTAVCSVRGDYFVQVISPEPKEPEPGEPIFTSRALKQKNRSLFTESKLLQF
jgi:hypothetical protein